MILFAHDDFQTLSFHVLKIQPLKLIWVKILSSLNLFVE